MENITNWLLPTLKDNLIIDGDHDDSLLLSYIGAAASYASAFQHLDYSAEGFELPAATRQAIIMLASHFYESRDGGTGGFFADNVNAAGRVLETVNLLLRAGKEWSV